jgi:hypothetical protein
MRSLPTITFSPALLREFAAQQGILLTEAVLPLTQFDKSADEDVAVEDEAPADETTDTTPTEPAAAAPLATPAIAVPITAPSDLQPGDPFTGQTPVLVSQDYQPVDEAGARQLAALGATGAGQVTCLLLQIPTKAAIALLNQFQSQHELDQQLEAGQAPTLANPFSQAATIQVADDELDAGPATLQLYGRFPAEEGARKGELYHIERLAYHTQAFKVDFENLVTIPERFLPQDKTPAAAVYELWNQGDNGARAALNVSLNREDYLRQAVIRQARQKGYDGIRYGQEWVQLIPS